jgi:thiamine pyrophosphate-dependent acetolactate synthase large subunit-like protein
VLARDRALTLIAAAAARHRAAVFIGNGLAPRALQMIADRDRNFYMVGSMGLALPLAVGFCRLARIPTIAVEGDGNALMGMPATALAPAAHGPLVHVVLDNHGYESTGGQRSPAPGFSFVDVARAAHYPMAVEVHDEAGFAAAFEEAITGRQVCMVHAHVARAGGGEPPPRIPLHPAEITDRFRSGIRKAVNA